MPPRGPPPASVSQIDFYNGMVEISCPNQMEWRGDLNLNGLAFEIADWILFADYFIKGYDVLE